MRKWYVPGLALLAFSYPMTTVAMSLAGMPVGPINMGLKAVYAGLFLISLIVSLSTGRARVPGVVLLLFVFFALYGVRLVIDILGRDITPPDSSGTYILAYFFLLTVLPSLATAVAYNATDLPLLRRVCFFVLFVSSLLIIVQFQQSDTTLAFALEMKRLEIRGAGEDLAQLNPITIGLTGGTLALFSLAQLSMYTQTRRFDLMVSAIGLVVGIVVLALSGSRGPLVAFGSAILFFLFAITRVYITRRRTGLGRLSRRVPVIAICGLGVVGYVVTTNSAGFLGLSRLIETFNLQEYYSSEIRYDIYNDALLRIFSSPFFGDGYLMSIMRFSSRSWRPVFSAGSFSFAAAIS
jgi:hypothetical protein